MERSYDTVIVWMRRDLRVHDNPCLWEACRRAKRVVPVFVLDDAILCRPDTGPARVAFLLDALQVLHANLRKRTGRLIVRRGQAVELIPRLAREWGAQAVFHHREVEPDGRRRDEAVAQALDELGVAVETFNTLTLFEPDEILTKTGSPYTVFSPYRRVWSDRPAERACPDPERVSVPEEIEGDGIPAPQSLGIQNSQTFACGGEDAALALLEDFVREKCERYAERRDLLAEEGTSRLSRHLHFGTVGPRQVVEAVRKAGRGEGEQTFLSEIAWRDFYFQILAHFPHVAEGAFRRQYDALEWENDPDRFEAWKQGRTGYPIVDAAMRQMRAEAWMHNRGRMIAASFLTKDLLIDWRWGEQFFMESLVDGDQAANNGGWQWAAGTGTDAQPFFRIFNPVSQGERFDPDGEYVRRWIPELRGVPAKFVHAPWKLSAREREHLGCADYPAPIVDHAVQRAKALTLYGKIGTR